jgi:hypothetical protein
MIGDVPDGAGLDPVSAGKVHQHTAIDRRAANGAALEVAPELQYILKRRHAAWLSR